MDSKTLKQLKTDFCLWALNHPMSPDNEWFVCNCLGNIIHWTESPFDWLTVIRKYNTDTEEETDIEKVIRLAERQKRLSRKETPKTIRRAGVPVRKAKRQKVRAVLESRKTPVRALDKPKKKVR